jgi:histidinol phosphatase-like PHP family hydrolase
MKYRIMEIVEPNQLEKKVQEGSHTYHIKRSLFQPVSIYGVVSFHNTMEDAEREIVNNTSVLKGLNITIIPVISIDINGNIR